MVMKPLASNIHQKFIYENETLDELKAKLVVVNFLEFTLVENKQF